MKKELEDQLKNKYPNLYETSFSFSCSDGWYNIIADTSMLINQSLTFLPEELQNQIKMVQVKEKFGTLRIYTNHTTPYISGVIDCAELFSSRVCEFCGEVGTLRLVKGYYFTGCQKHLEEQREIRRDINL